MSLSEGSVWLQLMNCFSSSVSKDMNGAHAVLTSSHISSNGHYPKSEGRSITGRRRKKEQSGDRRLIEIGYEYKALSSLERYQSHSCMTDTYILINNALFPPLALLLSTLYPAPSPSILSI